MKIGLLTFHRAVNYGAVLQCYALQEILKSLGHEVFVIDYRQPRVERTDRMKISLQTAYSLLRSFHFGTLFYYCLNRNKNRRRLSNFDGYLLNNINLFDGECDHENIPQSFDLYIVGSDQIWNTAICDGIDPVFWGNFVRPDKSKLISYAASTSLKNIKGLDSTKLMRNLSNFNAISVREYSVWNFLSKQTSVPPIHHVLDPTILADRDVWDSYDNNELRNMKYVLSFGVRAYKPHPNILKEKARILANEMKCDVLSIDFINDSPRDFISKIRNASAVVTSSYHGVVFSIVFRRNLYACLYGDDQDERYAELLNTIGASECLIDVQSDIHIRKFNYSRVDAALNELKKKSLSYIQNAVNNEYCNLCK